MPDDRAELQRLRAQVAALEELLDVQERMVSDQAGRLESQAADLAKSNHALEQFAYVISHDLQEPLRMVAAYTELLRESYQGKLDESADKYIGFASGGARRMQELINALLDYSRITTRGKELTAVALDRALDEALLNLAVAIEQSSAEIAREPLPTVRGDSVQLVRLLQNLIGNALKFREPDRGARVRITGVREGNRVRVSVIDQGIGIDPRHHARIFDVFRRIHPKRFPGTGIGLSVCQRIAERHGGGIRVESALGQGSTFSFTAPLWEEQP
jgi:light-regulated signal transduction histidine kinase (bacteriophytochrome)